VHIAVDAGATAFLRRRQQATILVGTNVAHGGVCRAGQFIDGKFSSFLTFHCCRRLAHILAQALEDGSGGHLSWFHGRDDSEDFPFSPPAPGDELSESRSRWPERHRVCTE